MKVLHLIHSPEIGGIRTLVRDLIGQQSLRPNVRPAVMFARMNGEPPADFTAIGAPIVDANLSSGYDISPVKIRRIYNEVRRYDIVHFHFFNPLLALCAILSRSPKIVYTFHGNFGFFRKTTIADVIKNKLLKVFLKLSVDFITYNSEFTKNTAIDYYSIINNRGKVIYNGLVLSKVRGNHENLPEKISQSLKSKFVVSGFGRFVRTKRFDRLISGYAQFQTDKEDTILLLLGDGPLKETLVTDAKCSGIMAAVIFAGFQRDIHDYQDATDICVVSSASEAFGLVAVEAMAMGIPVIAFADGGGAVEVVGGYSMDDVVQDVAELARRLDYYYRRRPASPHEADKIRRYAERFDIRHAEAKFFDAYNAIL